MAFEKGNTTPIEPVHEEAVRLDIRAGTLIERMHACRAAMATEDAEALDPRLMALTGVMLSYVGDWLAAGSGSYREGKSLDYLLDYADEAVQVVEGLLGLHDKSDSEAFGSRFRSLWIEMEKLQDSGENIDLADELLNRAIATVGHAFRFRKYTPALFSTQLESVKTLLDRAQEALRSDSAGVQLVSRLDALGPTLRLVRAA